MEATAAFTQARAARGTLLLSPYSRIVSRLTSSGSPCAVAPSIADFAARAWTGSSRNRKRTRTLVSGPRMSAPEIHVLERNGFASLPM